jgi:hypothetical protein
MNPALLKEDEWNISINNMMKVWGVDGKGRAG